MREIRGQLTLKILEMICDGTVATADIIMAILESGYGASHSRIRRKAQQIEYERLMSRESMVRRQRIDTTLSHLKKSKFLVVNQAQWKITMKGKEKLKTLKNLLRLPRRDYVSAPNKDLVVVTFDVPERERRKRDWLRAALKALGFSMLQQSVWIGKCKIPEEFIRDLVALRVFEYVEILVVTRSGTVRVYK